MSKITSVEPQKKNPRRFNVYLDGQFAFGANEDLVVNFRLLPGKEISTEDLEKLLYEVEVGKLMEKVYRLFGVRQRSEAEVRQYFKTLQFRIERSQGLAKQVLRVKNFELRIKKEEQISSLVLDSLVDRLKNKGMINDLEFARVWTDSRRRSKKLGPRALKVELIKKGIAREIIEQVLAEQPENNEQLAKEALEKRILRWKNLPEMEFRKKATEYLLRKGFDWEIVKEVIEKLLQKGYNTK